MDVAKKWIEASDHRTYCVFVRVRARACVHMCVCVNVCVEANANLVDAPRLVDAAEIILHDGLGPQVNARDFAVGVEGEAIPPALEPL